MGEGSRAWIEAFIERWERYFAGYEPPVTFRYSDEPKGAASSTHRCVICEVGRAREGETVGLDAEAVRCAGGKRYLGFARELRPGFEHFLSCGIPGQREGERYKASPELVRETLKDAPSFQAPGRYIVFERLDRLEEGAEPEAAIFFATPDVLSGLFTLFGFDEADPLAVIAPFSSGCGSIVLHPYLEARSDHPRAVIGMFDVSARPCVPPEILTFAVPFPRLGRMAASMDESFLITRSWERVRRRLGGALTKPPS